MSRIGRQPIELPPGVMVALSTGRVQVNGPLGELSQEVSLRMAIDKVDSSIVVARPTDRGEDRALHGLRDVERFTRVDAETLMYRATVDDPRTYTRPFTLEFPWRRDSNYGFYEYACHEGNHALHNILSGSRADDAAARK